MRHLILFILLGVSCVSFAQSTEVEREKLVNHTKGLGIQGYDPVAYLTQGKALKGTKERTATYLGVTYYFDSETNKQAFVASPSKYEPQYGGWCAYAMGYSGQKVNVDPETFKIIDGKLYLFYNAYFNNTLKSWNKDENNLKTKADENWDNVINKQP